MPSVTGLAHPQRRRRDIFVDAVIKYIQSQQQHHVQQSFGDEYRELLEKFEVEYNPRYVFKPIED